ncbi:MAG TPA: hypothetical protein ENG30_04245 [Thermofilaceae archaeon]|nr:hypothetical protein [Thermofilaceae archaeon]
MRRLKVVEITVDGTTYRGCIIGPSKFQTLKASNDFRNTLTITVPKAPGSGFICYWNPVTRSGYCDLIDGKKAVVKYIVPPFYLHVPGKPSSCQFDSWCSCCECKEGKWFIGMAGYIAWDGNEVPESSLASVIINAVKGLVHP